jgi:hypothetical protein
MNITSFFGKHENRWHAQKPVIKVGDDYDLCDTFYLWLDDCFIQ